MRSLGFDTAACQNTEQVSPKDSTVSLVQAYNNIPFPKSDAARYTRIRAEFDKGIEHATKNQHNFRMALLRMQQWATDSMHGFTERDNNQIELSAPPQGKKRSKTQNKSTLKLKRNSKSGDPPKARKRQCRACKQYGHRADNPMCPAKENQHAKTSPSEPVATSDNRSCRVCDDEEISGRICAVCSHPVHHMCSNSLLGEDLSDQLHQSVALCSNLCRDTYFK